MTRDTVFKLTPALAATSRIVGLVAGSDASFGFPLQGDDNDVNPGWSGP